MSKGELLSISTLQPPNNRSVQKFSERLMLQTKLPLCTQPAAATATAATTATSTATAAAATATAATAAATNNTAPNDRPTDRTKWDTDTDTPSTKPCKPNGWKRGTDAHPSVDGADTGHTVPGSGRRYTNGIRSSGSDWAQPERSTSLKGKGGNRPQATPTVKIKKRRTGSRGPPSASRTGTG